MRREQAEAVAAGLAMVGLVIVLGVVVVLTVAALT